MKMFANVYGLVIVHLLISQFQHFGSTLSLCEPAEESKGHTLSFNLDNIEVEDPVNGVLNVIMDKQTVANCSIQRGCHNFREKLFNASVNSNASNSKITISVEIFNVSRDTYKGLGQQWYIWNKKSIISSCKTVAFKRIKTISCQSNVSDHIIFITCLASQVYPKGSCEISVTMGHTFNLTKYVYTVNDVISTIPSYFNTKCFFTVPLSEFSPGLYEIKVTMYPNVHDNVMDKHFGGNRSITINLDYPSVTLKDCPEIVEENSEVTCTCHRSDNSLINVSIGWFDHNDTQIETKNGTLTLNANDLISTLNKVKGLFCKIIGNQTWMNSNSTRLYSPIIVTEHTAVEIDYSNIILKTILPATLAAVGMFLIFLTLKFKGIKAAKNSYVRNILHNKEEEIDNSVIYKIDCNKKYDMTIYSTINTLPRTLCIQTHRNDEQIISKPFLRQNVNGFFYTIVDKSDRYNMEGDRADTNKAMSTSSESSEDIDFEESELMKTRDRQCLNMYEKTEALLGETPDTTETH